MSFQMIVDELGRWTVNYASVQQVSRAGAGLEARREDVFEEVEDAATWMRSGRSIQFEAASPPVVTLLSSETGGTALQLVSAARAAGPAGRGGLRNPRPPRIQTALSRPLRRHRQRRLQRLSVDRRRDGPVAATETNAPSPPAVIGGRSSPAPGAHTTWAPGWEFTYHTDSIPCFIDCAGTTDGQRLDERVRRMCRWHDGNASRHRNGLCRHLRWHGEIGPVWSLHTGSRQQRGLQVRRSERVTLVWRHERSVGARAPSTYPCPRRTRRASIAYGYRPAIPASPRAASWIPDGATFFALACGWRTTAVKISMRNRPSSMRRRSDASGAVLYVLSSPKTPLPSRAADGRPPSVLPVGRVKTAATSTAATRESGPAVPRFCRPPGTASGLM